MPAKVKKTNVLSGLGARILFNLAHANMLMKLGRLIAQGQKNNELASIYRRYCIHVWEKNI